MKKLAYRAAFAVPGDIATVTGGYGYDRALIEGLKRAGWEVDLVSLGASYPDPTQADTRDAAQKLAALNPNHPVIIDGLALGAMEEPLLHQIAAPIVAMIHHPLAFETGLSDQRRDYLLGTERNALAVARHVLVPSPHTAQLLQTEYGVAPDRITIAPPGTKSVTAKAGRVDPPLILSVGIQVPRKGHDVLVRALAQMKDHAWQAVIAGRAQDKDHALELSSLVTDLGLTDRVRLAGQVSDTELAQLYAQASIFALATRHEGYGIVFDEAMAHGLPIISCAVGAVPDTVAPKAGLLVSPDDACVFAEALMRVLGDKELAADMAAAALKASTELPEWDTTIARVDHVLRRFLSGAKIKGLPDG